MGTMLALTGRRLSGLDAKVLGLATHTLASDDVPRVVNELATALADVNKSEAAGVVGNVLSRLETQLQAVPSDVAPRRAAIDGWFAGDSLEDIVAALIARNADVNYRSPLVLAAAQGFVGIVERLLRSGAIVNQACGESAAMCGGLDNLGATALHAAARLAKRCWSGHSGCCCFELVRLMKARSEVGLIVFSSGLTGPPCTQSK